MEKIILKQLILTGLHHCKWVLAKALLLPLNYGVDVIYKRLSDAAIIFNL